MPLEITSAAEQLELQNDMISFFGKLQSEMLIDERYHDLDFGDELSLPSKFASQAVILPTAREVVETAVDHISPNNRRVDVPRRAATQAAAKQTKLLRRFYSALLFYLEQGAPVSPYREMLKHLSVWGISVTKFIYDEKKWMDKPGKGEDLEDWRNFQATNMPYTLQVLHPSEVLFDPWHDPSDWVIQHSQKYVGDLMSTYPDWGNPQHLKRIQKVDVSEFWSTTQRSVLINKTDWGLKGGIIENEATIHPYTIGSSGLGIDGSGHTPEKRFVGILRYLRGILQSESRNYSIADIVMKSGAWPVRVLVGERASEVGVIELEYGTMRGLPEGVTIEQLTPELPPGMVMEHLAIANNIISAAAAPRVVRGGQNPGTRAGFQQQLAIGEARLRYAPLAEAVERMMTQICVKAGIYMEKVIPGSVSLGAGATNEVFASISAKDFRGHHAVRVKVNVLAPEDEIRKQQGVISLVAAGLMSPIMAIETLFPAVDPDSELARILAARILFSPQLMGLVGTAVTQEVASAAGLEQVLEQMLAEAQAEATGGRGGQAQRQPPQPGEPPVTGDRADQANNRQESIAPGREELR